MIWICNILIILLLTTSAHAQNFFRGGRKVGNFYELDIKNEINLEDPDSGQNDVTIKATTDTTAYTITLPTDSGTNNQVFARINTGGTKWADVSDVIDGIRYDQITDPTDKSGISFGTFANTWTSTLSGTFFTIDGVLGEKVLAVTEGDVTFTNSFTVTGTSVFNEDSLYDSDFRIESDNDANIFVVDSSEDAIGIGTATPDFHLDIHHTADELGDITFHIEHDINSLPSTIAMQIDVVATALGSEEEASGIVVSINKADSTGGEIDGLTVVTVGSGSAETHALRVSAGVEVIEHDSGTVGNVGFCEIFDDSLSSFTDCLAAASSTSTDVSIFVEDNDILYIGLSTNFSIITFDLDTGASGGGIKPTFQHSSTGDTFVTFGPLDTTSGMHESGVILIDVDVVGGDWVTATVDGDSAFWVRITRTRNNLTTVPIENLIQTSATTAFEWDKDGNVTINNLTVPKIESSTGILTIDSQIQPNSYSGTMGDTSGIDFGTFTNTWTSTVNGNFFIMKDATIDRLIIDSTTNAWTMGLNGTFDVGDFYKIKGTTAIDMDVVNTNLWVGVPKSTNLDVSADSNVIMGFQAGESLTTGDDNVFIGNVAGQNVTTGGGNFALGAGALSSLITANNNVAIGLLAMDASNVDGARTNVAIGKNALRIVQNENNVAIGNGVLALLVSAGQNVMIGGSAGANQLLGSSVGIGRSSFGGSQAEAVYVGMQAGLRATGATRTICIGFKCGEDHDGIDNTFVGYRVAETQSASVTGSRNVAMGKLALTDISSGTDNTIIGFEGGKNITTGTQNTILGSNSGEALIAEDGNVFIGYNVANAETVADELWIDNSNTGSPLIHGNFNSNTVTVYGLFSVSDLIHIIDKNDAQATCTLGDIYMDTSGALCVCTDNSNTWTNTTGVGSCA